MLGRYTLLMTPLLLLHICPEEPELFLPEGIPERRALLTLQSHAVYPALGYTTVNVMEIRVRFARNARSQRELALVYFRVDHPFEWKL